MVFDVFTGRLWQHCTKFKQLKNPFWYQTLVMIIHMYSQSLYTLAVCESTHDRQVLKGHA